MRSCSPLPRPDPPRLERARPLLGTVVAVAVEARAPEAARAALEAAFAAAARVHALMSYHDPGSELSRLNREAAARPTPVDPLTFEVLARAISLSARTGGVFDVTVAPALEAAGALPEAEGPEPDPAANWRDIRLDDERTTVRFVRPLRIDLGGIAKGFAVDQALRALRAAGASAGVVNAGGDLRVFGRPEAVALRTGDPAQDGRAVLEIEDGALASSGRLDAVEAGEPVMGLHYAGAGGAAVTGRFACVAAPECVLADALTKVVLAQGADCADLLASLGAQAHAIGPERVWRSFGARL